MKAVEVLGQGLGPWLVFMRPNLGAWCVVTAVAGREKSAQAALAAAGWSTYLPMETVKRKVGGRNGERRVARQPLFSRYLFAAMNEGGDTHAPKDIPEIMSIRRHPDGVSSVLPQSLVCRLMLTEANHGFDETYERPKPKRRRLVCGVPVRIRGGVLEGLGLEAVIERVLSEREVVAKFTLFGSEGVAHFDSADLEAVDDVRDAA